LGLETSPEDVRVTIKPSNGWKIIDFKELKHYKELIFFMTWRDLKVRYKQTILGAAWAIIQPVMTMVVFSIFFGNLAKVPSDGIPYPLFSLAGLLPWQLFENSLRNASKSLVANRNMITKIYFPRIVLPLSSVLACIVDFFVALPILIGFMIYYQYSPNIYALLIPYYLLLTVITAFGVKYLCITDSVLFASDRNNRIRCQLMVFGDGCDVSRYRVYCPVYQPVVDVLNADRLRIGNHFEPQAAIYL